MKNKKGFTLIELLAVIIILGVLMIIAVPSVTKYINDSRRNGYVSTAKEIAGGARNLIHSGGLNLNDKDTTYYIDSECIDTSNSTESPYGEFTKAYVVVNYNDDGYDYYWLSVDDTGNGVKTITSIENLDIDSIESNLTSNDILDTVGVDARHNYVIINKENGCTIGNSTVATSRVTDDGEVDVVDYPAGKSNRTLSYGDIVTIGDQEFYYLSHNGTDTILIARYNLKVGNDVRFEQMSYGYRVIVDKTYGPNDTGYRLQDSECIGSDGSHSLTKCVLTFSQSLYWDNQVGEGKKYPDKYVYDENSDLYSHFEYYKNYLEEFGVNIKEIRTLKYDDYSFSINLSNLYVLHSSVYWTGYVYNYPNYNNYISLYLLGNKNGGVQYYSNSTAGARPVIVI